MHIMCALHVGVIVCSHTHVSEILRLGLDVFLSRPLQKPGPPTEHGVQTWNMEHGLG